MSKNLTENYPIVDTVEALEERLAGVRELNASSQLILRNR